MTKFKIKEKDLYFKTKKGLDTNKIERIEQLEISIANLELFILTAYEKLDDLKHEKFMLSKGYDYNLRKEMEKMKNGNIL